MKKTVIECDVCFSTTSKDFYEIKIPSIDNMTDSFELVDVCEECLNKIWNFIITTHLEVKEDENKNV